MESQHAFLEFLFLLLALPLSYAMAKWMQYLSKPDYTDDIKSDFLREWNGKPEDEYYAWLRLRRRYLYHDSQPIHLKFIHQKISELNKRDKLSDTVVTESGKIDIPLYDNREKK